MDPSKDIHQLGLLVGDGQRRREGADVRRRGRDPFREIYLLGSPVGWLGRCRCKAAWQGPFSRNAPTEFADRTV